MKVSKVTLQLGLPRPLNIAHLTDIHLCLADQRDPHLIKHAQARGKVFYEEAGCPSERPEEMFAKAMALSEETCDLTVITGDILDFVSQANLDASDAILRHHDYMFTAGNHEFCPQVGIPDSHARRIDMYQDLQTHYKGSMFFQSRVMDGVNLIAMDNSYYFFSDLQIQALKKEIEKGLPILLFFHVPLTEPILNLQYFHKDLVPDGYMQKKTNEMLDLIASCPLIKAEFSGHWHVRRESIFRDAVPEYVTPGCFKGEMTQIELI